MGHIDGVGKVKLLEQKNEFYKLEIELQPSEAKYVVKKGSITINGISLTVADINENIIEFAVIPNKLAWYFTLSIIFLRDSTAKDFIAFLSTLIT